MNTKTTFTRICKSCGTAFQAHTTVTQCCGTACARKWYKTRKKVEKINKSVEETADVMNVQLEVIKAKTFLSIEDTRQLIGISRRTIMRLLRNGRIPFAKFGRRTLISREHIDQFFQHHQI